MKNRIPEPIEALTYLKIILTTTKCDAFGFPMNLLTMATLNAKSGLVMHKYLNDPINLMYCVGLIYYLSSFFNSCNLGSAGGNCHIIMLHFELLQYVKRLPPLMYEKSLFVLKILNSKEICHETKVAHLKLLH